MGRVGKGTGAPIRRLTSRGLGLQFALRAPIAWSHDSNPNSVVLKAPTNLCYAPLGFTALPLINVSSALKVRALT